MGLDDIAGVSENNSSKKSKSKSSKKKTKQTSFKTDSPKQEVDIEDVDKSEWDMIISHPKDPRYEVDGIEHLSNVLVTFNTEEHPSGIDHNAGLDEEEYINIESNKTLVETRSMSGKETVNIHKSEFEKALEETGLDFEEVDYRWADECIYEASSSGGLFSIRVYSTIDQSTNESRGSGEDSIKVNVVHNETNQPLFTVTRTYRIKTWKKNLHKKIKEIIEKKSEIKKCDNCGSIMVVRENNDSGNKFLGCTSYPDCKNTKPLDQ